MSFAHFLLAVGSLAAPTEAPVEPVQSIYSDDGLERPSYANPPAQSAVAIPTEVAVEDRAERIEKMALDYRIVVYDTFRKDRAVFNERRGAARNLVESLHRAGYETEEFQSTVRWMQAATAASRVESVGPLPPFPEFHGASVSADSAPAQRDVDSADEALAPHAAGNRSEPGAAGTTDEAGKAETLTPPLVSPGIPVLERKTPDIDAPGRTTDASPTTNRPDTTGASPGRKRAPVLRDVLDLLTGKRPRATDVVVDRENVADRTTAPATLDVPAGSRSAPGDRVNWDAVVARVAGHNLAVAQLEDDVQAAPPAALTFAQVQDFVTRMERLAAGVEDLQPYYLLAPESIRPQLAQLGRPKKSPALLAGAIARLRTELQERAETAPATDGPKPGDFDNLSRRLAEAVHRLK